MEIKVIDIVSNALCNHAAAAISFSAHRRFERGAITAHNGGSAISCYFERSWFQYVAMILIIRV